METEERRCLVSTTYRVQNMHSLADSEHIYKIIMSINGVEETLINLENKTVTVRHNRNICSEESIEYRINEITGFEKKKYSAFYHPTIMRSLSFFSISFTTLVLIAVFHFLIRSYVSYRFDLYLGIFITLLFFIHISPTVWIRIKQNRWVDINILMIISVFSSVFLENWFSIALLVTIISLVSLVQACIYTKMQRLLKESYVSPQESYGTLFEGNIKCKVENIPVGSMIIIKSGETIPLDGIIVQGYASVYEGTMTGESLPAEKLVGSNVYAGTYVLKGQIVVQTISDSGSSSLSKLKSVSSEANPQTYILDHIMDRFTVIYGSIVSVLSITFAIYLIILYRNNLADKWKEIGHKVLLILVLACPCALCLAEALPNSLTIIKLINKKIFVMRGRILETLTKLKFLAFDKTGTLTNGQFRVHNCHRLNESNDKLLKLIAIGELKFGNHPIAVAIYNYVTGVINVTSNYRNKDLDMIYSNDLILNNQPGLGFSYDIEGHTIYIGSNEWMKINGISLCEIEETVNQDLTQVYAAIDHKLVFIFYLFDTPRPSASAAIQKLKNKKIDVGIISGDGRGPTYQSYKIVDADEYNYSHTPREKMNYIRNKNVKLV